MSARPRRQPVMKPSVHLCPIPAGVASRSDIAILFDLERLDATNHDYPTVLGIAAPGAPVSAKDEAAVRRWWYGIDGATVCALVMSGQQLDDDEVSAWEEGRA